ncbi:MAG TPA: TetR/AcrR family transcriptional regulator [Phototrophicaceae bacterium]|nr:TetR/AcrR family transcriptional regulator [Phototrophicaceae bacterium]
MTETEANGAAGGGGAPLQPAVRAAHGVGARGAGRGLSLDRIVRAAMELADEDGLAAVSMARVAARLEFTPMSLYRHVGSKDELLAHMQDGAIPPPPDRLAPPGDWRAGLRRWTEEQIDAAVRRPWYLEIPITGPPLMPNALAWMEVAMEVMEGLPLTGAEKLAVLQLLFSFARGEATLAVNLARAYAERGIGPADEGPVYTSAMAVLTEGRFPRLHAMAVSDDLLEVPAGVADEDADAYLRAFSLDRILDGVAALVAERRVPHGDPPAGTS